MTHLTSSSSYVCSRKITSTCVIIVIEENRTYQFAYKYQLSRLFFLRMNHARALENALENLRNILGVRRTAKKSFLFTIRHVHVLSTCFSAISRWHDLKLQPEIFVKAVNEIKDFITVLRRRRSKYTICKVFSVNRISYLKRSLSLRFEFYNIPIDIHERCCWLVHKKFITTFFNKLHSGEIRSEKYWK